MKLDPREIAAELLHAHWESLYYHSLTPENADVDPPGAFHLFEMVFDLMSVPSRDLMLRMRLPRPGKPGDYWTRDDLVKEFYRLYDDAQVEDDKLVDIYLELLTSLAPEQAAKREANPIAEA